MSVEPLGQIPSAGLIYAIHAQDLSLGERFLGAKRSVRSQISSGMEAVQREQQKVASTVQRCSDLQQARTDEQARQMALQAIDERLRTRITFEVKLWRDARSRSIAKVKTLSGKEIRQLPAEPALQSMQLAGKLQEITGTAVDRKL